VGIDDTEDEARVDVFGREHLLTLFGSQW
jgi:hypothetical protein